MVCDWSSCLVNFMLQQKLLGTLIMLMVHAIVGFTNTLLESEDMQWGLYEWCSVEEGKTTKCHPIHPGESPAYFEAARISVAVSVVMIFLHIPMFIWTPADNSICQWIIKLVLTLLPSLNVGTTLGLVGAYYKDDDRWKDSNPSLNGNFNCLIVFAALDLVPTCFFFWCFARAFAVMICDQQTRPQRQGRHSSPPPNVEPISNQGEKNQILCCEKLHSAKIKASILWKTHTLCCQRLNCATIKASILWKTRTLCCQRLNSAKIKASILWKHICRKVVTAMKCLMISICGKRLSRKLVITMKRLGPGTVQDIPDNPLCHQPGQPERHGSPPIRHAPGGPAGDLPPGIDQHDASDTSSVRAGRSEEAARYNAADAYRSKGTTVHQTAGQDDVSSYSTMDTDIHQGTPPERSGRSTAMDPVIGLGGQEELPRSHSARDAPRVHSICRSQLPLADFQSFVNPQTNHLIFQLRRPGQTGVDTPTTTYI